MMTPLGPMKVHCPAKGQSSLSTDGMAEPSTVAPAAFSDGNYREEFYHRLRKRVGWLNMRGGFENAIGYDKVAETMSIVGTDEGTIMKILQELERLTLAGVDDETTWIITEILREGAEARKRKEEKLKAQGQNAADD